MMIAILYHTLVIGKKQLFCIFKQIYGIFIQSEGLKIIVTALAKGAIMQK